MNKVTKNKWLEELKSEKYGHHKSSLRSNENSFCALGILCSVVDPDGWKFNNQRQGEVHWSHRNRYAFPDQEILDMAGLSQSQVRAIIQMNETNDGFDEIIKYVEKHL